MECSQCKETKSRVVTSGCFTWFIKQVGVHCRLKVVSYKYIHVLVPKKASIDPVSSPDDIPRARGSGDVESIQSLGVIKVIGHLICSTYICFYMYMHATNDLSDPKPSHTLAIVSTVQTQSSSVITREMCHL